PEDPAELRAVNRLLANEVKALTLKVEQLQHQLHGHNRHRFGSKAESSDQLNLTFVEDEQIAEAARDQAQPSPESTQDKPPRQHSRKPLPDQRWSWNFDRIGARIKVDLFRFQAAIFSSPRLVS
ncbi:MAG: transposase, partial [Pseudomonadota bacterium]